ncbi:MAG TPA: FkbM family methyltransferase, partial [Vicinamibacterales bacterium]|nr:FkbM family methyltransferase [Vicinamibacterales bacterium]
HIADGFDAHLQQLDGALRNPGADDERSRRFVEAFVRPFGREVAATPRLVEAIERLAARPAPVPERSPLWAPFVRPFIARAGAALVRKAVFAEEARLARALGKRRQRPTAAETEPAEPTGTPPAHAKRPIRNWKDLARAYRTLDYRQRVYFGRATLDAVPGELLQSVFEYTAPERLDYAGADILVRVTSKAVRARLRACAKEPFTINWIHEWVLPDEVFFDIGANIGVYSLVAAKKVGGGARVYAFDPSYGNIASLTSNILLNDLADRVTPLPVALSDRTGMEVFSLRSMEPGSARHTLGDAPSGEGPAVYRQPVLAYRLDDLIDQFGIPLPNHIKLDVDGGELAVLAGASRALASPSLRSMLIEVSTEMSDAITEVLARHGLRLHARVNVQNRAGEYRVWYGLFTRAEQPAAVSREPLTEVVSR